MAYRFTGSSNFVSFDVTPINGSVFGPLTLAGYLKSNSGGSQRFLGITDSGFGTRVGFSFDLVQSLLVNGTTSGTISTASTTPWYLTVVTWAGGAALPRFHLHDGTSWTHADAASSGSSNITAIVGTDKILAGTGGGSTPTFDLASLGIKKTSSTDLQVATLSPTSFASWQAFGFDWLANFDAITTRTNLGAGSNGNETARSGVTLVTDPFVSASTFTPQIIWFTPAPATTPTAPTYASATSYAQVANRPAVTGTTRPFASSAALTGALSAAAPGDLVSYTGAGILDIPGNYVGFAGRRYTGYVNIDLGLPASANHVRFTGGGGAGLPAVGIYNSTYLRIYGGEITNPPPKSVGHDGLHVYGAGHAGDGSTHHITWWNLSVHDTVDGGIKLMPNVPFGGAGQTSADNTIADCDIEATVYMIGRDKTADTHPEQGTGQHCANLADTDPSGATYPSFLRNRVAIDGYNTGLSSSQGGGSVIELGFNDAASTITGCTLILRGNNTLFNAQQQTAGNGLNLWGDAVVNAAVPFLQHSNATGSAVCNFPPGYNRSGVVVAYGRHSSTNRNAYEGTNPWQIGPTYTNVA